MLETTRRRRVTRAPVPGVALVLALLCSLLAGTPARAAGGYLAGTVTGPDELALGSFAVEVYRADGPDRWVVAASRTIWSSADGSFSIPLPAGTYRACFGEPVDDWYADVGRRCWSDGYEVWDATDIVVTDGGTTTITPALPREARVRGRIVGAGGDGVSAYVAPYRRLPDGSWGWSGGEQSLADGTFLVPDLDPGTYRFCLLDVPRVFFAECWDDVVSLTEAQDVTIAPGTTTRISFWLSRKASISGTVTRPAGSAGSITVAAYRRQNDQWAAVENAGVAADGSYRIAPLSAGTYRVCADGYDIVRSCWRASPQIDAATDVVLATDRSRANVDLAPGGAGFVTGTLPDVYLGAQGYPYPTAWRQVGLRWEAVAVGEAVPTGIGNDWTYTIGSLPTGTYVVCVEHAEPEFVPAFPQTCNGGSPTAQGGIPFDVVEGSTTTDVDIVTGRAGTIQGRVPGAPTRVRVDLFAPSGRLALSARTNADGFFRFGNLPAGDYRLGFHRATARTSLAAEWWRNRPDGVGPAGATPITVDGVVVGGIGVTLDQGGVITGRLLDQADAPVAGCVVQARSRDGSLAIRTAVTGTDGSFALGGLSTASYVVLVTRTCSGAPTALFHDSDSPSGTTARLRDADDVAVTLGRTTTLADDLHTAG